MYRLWALVFCLLTCASPTLAELGLYGWGPRLGAGDDPDQILIGVHFHIFVLRLFSWTGLKAFRPFAFEIIVGKVDTGDHRKRFAGNAGQFRHRHMLDQPWNQSRITDGAGADERCALQICILCNRLVPGMSFSDIRSAKYNGTGPFSVRAF